MVILFLWCSRVLNTNSLLKLLEVLCVACMLISGADYGACFEYSSS